MIKAAVVIFAITFSVISFGLSSFSLNYDDMNVYPVDSEDINFRYSTETTDEDIVGLLIDLN